MKTTHYEPVSPSPWLLVLLALEILALPALASDPQIDSWLTRDSGQYARIYLNGADQLAGKSVTTWSRGAAQQTQPAYSGVQEIDSSVDWVYLWSTGLGVHVMGPWYLDPGKTELFPNLPANTKTLYRIPRHPSSPDAKVLTGLGPIGIFVDGVAMYDSRDALSWNGSSEVPGPNGGYWNRDAYVNEKPSFDPSNAHQDQSGTYHYHANPPALRYLLGDNVLFDGKTKTYRENTALTQLKHSPILGWVSDGYPIYGPYGYGNSMDPKGGVRRMISGYVPRNGQNGADNLTATGRKTLPAWAVRFYHVAANQSGPAVNGWYPLGRYMEDNAYLGDLGKKLGKDFDLDECNGRFCVTPEFPQGTYAYFVSITPDGTPVFPYNIGRAFHGNPTGGSGQSIPEKVTTNFLGAPLLQVVAAPAVKATNGAVTLVWNSAEGGTYRIEESGDGKKWTELATNLTAKGAVTEATVAGNPAESFRIERTALATYDPVTGGSARGRRGGPGGRGGRGEMGGPGGPGGRGGMGTGIASVTPSSAKRGDKVTLTINFGADAQPPMPPADAPVAAVKIGGIAASQPRHVSQNQVQVTVSIPANASPGAQAVTVAFPGPPFDRTSTVSYKLDNAFTIQ